MAKIKLNKDSGWKDWLKLVLLVIAGALIGVGVDVAVRPAEGEIEASVKLELAQEQVEATMISENGEEIAANIPTVEAIDGGELLTEECKEGEECGRGWWVDTSTPQAFMDAIYGLCVDTDGHYGSQCWDAANLFWQNYAGKTFSTCGTGAAKGSLDCYEQNAGEEFVMIWDASQLQPGDWVIFTNGTYGHVGMAIGYYNEGYISLLGTNQGGTPCQGGGSTANVINISLKNFGGAFRPKSYIIDPEPTPIIPITGCVEWHLAHGDTMSKIMYECEGFLEYGEVMNNYAKSWYSRYAVPGQSVYDGWHSESGIGLYADDWIDHKF